MTHNPTSDRLAYWTTSNEVIESTRMWIAADVKSQDGRVWELIGVFDSAEKADAACTEQHHCYFSALLNERLPDESHVAPDVRYPRYEESQ